MGLFENRIKSLEEAAKKVLNENGNPFLDTINRAKQQLNDTGKNPYNRQGLDRFKTGAKEAYVGPSGPNISMDPDRQSATDKALDQRSGYGFYGSTEGRKTPVVPGASTATYSANPATQSPEARAADAASGFGFSSRNNPNPSLGAGSGAGGRSPSPPRSPLPSNVDVKFKSYGSDNEFHERMAQLKYDREGIRRGGVAIRRDYTNGDAKGVKYTGSQTPELQKKYADNKGEQLANAEEMKFLRAQRSRELSAKFAERSLEQAKRTGRT